MHKHLLLDSEHWSGRLDDRDDDLAAREAAELKFITHICTERHSTTARMVQPSKSPRELWEESPTTRTAANALKSPRELWEEYTRNGLTGMYVCLMSFVGFLFFCMISQRDVLNYLLMWSSYYIESNVVVQPEEDDDDEGLMKSQYGYAYSAGGKQQQQRRHHHQVGRGDILRGDKVGTCKQGSSSSKSSNPIVSLNTDLVWSLENSATDFLWNIDIMVHEQGL